MKAIKLLTAALATTALTACTVHKADAPPPLSGPSGFALSVTMVAIPDSISQDGGSQSSIRVTAIGPNGRPLASQPFRMDTVVNGVAQDYGSLSARTVVTNSDGVASLVYTAPPSPPGGLFGTCQGLPGTCIQIVATATGSDFAAANPQSVQIRLVPTGVILPPASTPTAAFTISPQPVANVPLQFDASSSQPGTGASQIVSYNWTFGDGGSATGRTVTHTYTASNTYTLTLTVTNDRNLSASTTQQISVGGGALPTPQFTFSPASPGVNETVFFNASTSTPGAGHTIVSYRWTFGDGGTASGVTVSHAFATAGTYTVQLTVVDEAGQSATSDGTPITPGTPPGPTANFTFSPQSPSVGDTVVFDWRTSSTSQGQRIVSLDWNFGDGSPIVHCPGNAACTADGITTHVFTRTGDFVVNLVVTDSAGRTSAAAPATIVVGGGNPIPSFTVSPGSPTAGQSATFDASGTQTSGGATIQSYSWNFGDPGSGANNTSTDGPVASHSYVGTGSRTVTLTVIDSLGRRGTVSVAVTVQ